MAAWPELAPDAPTNLEGRRPVRDDRAPSRHSIPTEWSQSVDPQMLFNCANAKCVLVYGDTDAFSDSQEGQLKAVHPEQEVLGRVGSARIFARSGL